MSEPGSNEAIAQGCTCPQMDNLTSLGRFVQAIRGGYEGDGK